MQHKDCNLWVGSLWRYDNNNSLLVILEWSIRSSGLRTLCRMRYLKMQMYAPEKTNSAVSVVGSWWLCASPVYPWSRKSGGHGEPVSKGARTNGEERGQCAFVVAVTRNHSGSLAVMGNTRASGFWTATSTQHRKMVAQHSHGDEKKHIQNWSSYKLYLYLVC